MRPFLILIAVTACGSKTSNTPPDTCNDLDGDGQTDCAGDCDDNDPFTMSGGGEICGDNKDNNCDGAVDDICNGLGTWVSQLTGDDANPGTQALPVKTIAKGMANA